MNKLRLWDQYDGWESAECAWEQGIPEASQQNPIKSLKQLPAMVGITAETKKHLKWKSFKWMLAKDANSKILKGFLKHPFRYGIRLMKSMTRTNPYTKVGKDFFLYGINSIAEFEELIHRADTLFVLGFSYCHKPFECPSGRFSDACIHDPDHPVCRQCFIGKCLNALPEKNCVPLIIPTVHYVGEKMFELVHRFPKKTIAFVITACEMTLEMFGDWGNMLDIKGVGIRLDGRICNTMQAFALSEEGIKPGLTVVLDDSQKKILEFIKSRRCQK